MELIVCVWIEINTLPNSFPSLKLLSPEDKYLLDRYMPQITFDIGTQTVLPDFCTSHHRVHRSA